MKPFSYVSMYLRIVLGVVVTLPLVVRLILGGRQYDDFGPKA